MTNAGSPRRLNPVRKLYSVRRSKGGKPYHSFRHAFRNRQSAPAKPDPYVITVEEEDELDVGSVQSSPSKMSAGGSSSPVYRLPETYSVNELGPDPGPKWISRRHAGLLKRRASSLPIQGKHDTEASHAKRRKLPGGRRPHASQKRQSEDEMQHPTSTELRQRPSVGRVPSPDITHPTPPSTSPCLNCSQDSVSLPLSADESPPPPEPQLLPESELGSGTQHGPQTLTPPEMDTEANSAGIQHVVFEPCSNPIIEHDTEPSSPAKVQDHQEPVAKGHDPRESVVKETTSRNISPIHGQSAPLFESIISAARDPYRNHSFVYKVRYAPSPNHPDEYIQDLLEDDVLELDEEAVYNFWDREGERCPRPDGTWEVYRIIGWQLCPRNVNKVKVHWAGFRPRGIGATWEPEKNLFENPNVAEMIAEYKATHRPTGMGAKKRKRSRKRA